MSDRVFFGFKEVDVSDKQNLVNRVFSSVSSKYDIMNDLMSFGIHRLWKRQMVNEITDYSKRILDVAGGTGDIAYRCFKKAIKNRIHPNITIFDINREMLAIGRDKFLDKGIFNGVNWICGNAEEIALPTSSIDYYTCAFGIRNMTNLEKILSEAYRVLKPGGKFICMEFSHVSNDLLSKAYDSYSINLIPQIGKIIAKDQDSYQYLVESIKKFPHQREFARMIENAGFVSVKYQNLTGGICAIHTGYNV